jgi:N-acyl-D-amino-acid deacylase
MKNAFRRIAGLSSLVCLLVCAALTLAQSNETGTYDIIINNGRIIDGSGNPWVSGDIAISGDRIAKIGKLANARAKRIVDANGLVVAQGLSTCSGNQKLLCSSITDL